MNICAIASEYNPFHNGHLYHIKKTRQILGPDTSIISIMSGNFVQRGDFAVMDKYKRALSAVCCGADLVLELPVPFSLCSAETFAYGIIFIAHSLGIVTHLSFGCESDDIRAFMSVSNALADKKIHSQISAKMKTGLSYAAARKLILQSVVGNDAAIVDSPNNILAVEYLRALRRFNSNILPVFIKRCGAMHDYLPPLSKNADASFFSNPPSDSCTAPCDSRSFNKNSCSIISSASFIRKLLAEKSEQIQKYMPHDSFEILRSEISCGRAPVTTSNAMRAILARLRSLREMDIASLPDAGAGLSHRIFRAIRDGADFYEIVNLSKTRVYPESRIRRILMRAYLGITPDMTENPPLYTSVLAFNTNGRSLLRLAQSSSKIPIISRPAESKQLSVPIREAFDFSVRSDDLFALGYPSISDTHGKEGFRRIPESLL